MPVVVLAKKIKGFDCVPLTTFLLPMSVESHVSKLERHCQAHQADEKMVRSLAMVVDKEKIVQI